MPTSRRIVDAEGEDFYPTPIWATKVLLTHEVFIGNVWEPACGNGAMSEVIKVAIKGEVFSSDLHDRGYGDNIEDFIYSSRSADNIITNPPYNLAEQFVEKGLRITKRKLCLLLRLSFLESARRFESIFNKHPPSRVWVFSERITFYPNGIQTAGTGTLAYAWFVWDRAAIADGYTLLQWFPPGHKSNTVPVDMDKAINL